MRNAWMGAALVTLALAGRATAQGPVPPPGGPGPMYQPTFANEPTPMTGPQFCPPGGGGEPPSPLSLSNDGSPNAWCEPEPQGCGAGNGWYVSMGWTMLRRQSLGGQVIAIQDPGNNIPGIPKNADTGFLPSFANSAPAILPGDISQNWMSGFSGALGWREGPNAFELSGFYIPQSSSGRAVVLPGGLDVPFNFFPTPVGFQGDNFLWLQADAVNAFSSTALGNVEANFRRHAYGGLEWLVGARYVDLDEKFGILTDDDGFTVTPRNLTQVATYSTREHSHIVAAQLGFDWECPLLSWLSVGVTGKGAWGCNFVDRSTLLQRGDGFVGFSTNSSSRQFSHMYDLSAWGTWMITEQFRIKAGYQLFWLVNVPEANQQLDYNLGNPYGRNSPHGSILYQGPMVQLQFAF